MFVDFSNAMLFNMIEMRHLSVQEIAKMSQDEQTSHYYHYTPVQCAAA
jgi:hypothetical protein